MLIRVHVVGSLARPPTLIWWGRGRIMVKARTSAFYWKMSYPIFYFSGKHEDSCNKLHQVCQLFFPWLLVGFCPPSITKITLPTQYSLPIAQNCTLRSVSCPKKSTYHNNWKFGPKFLQNWLTLQMKSIPASPEYAKPQCCPPALSWFVFNI